MKTSEKTETSQTKEHKHYDSFTTSARLIYFRVTKAQSSLQQMELSNPDLFQSPEMTELNSALAQRLCCLDQCLKSPSPSIALVLRDIERLEEAGDWEDAREAIIRKVFQDGLLEFDGTSLAEFIVSNFQTSKLNAPVNFVGDTKIGNNQNANATVLGEYDQSKDLIRIFDSLGKDSDELFLTLGMHGSVTFQLSLLYHELIHRSQLARKEFFPEFANLLYPLITLWTVYQDKLELLVDKINDYHLNFSSSDHGARFTYSGTKKESYDCLLLELDAYFAGYPFGFSRLDEKLAHRLIDHLTHSENYRSINPLHISRDKAVALAEKILFLKANGCPQPVLNNLVVASQFDQQKHSYPLIDEFVSALRSNLPKHSGKEWKKYMHAWILDWEAQRFIDMIKASEFVRQELRTRAFRLT